MAYNYLTQHTHTSNSGWGPLGGGGGGDAVYGKPKWTKIGSAHHLLHIPYSSASYPLWYQSEFYNIVSPWILSQTNCKQIL